MDKFCAEIHNNLALTLTNGGITTGPCCWFKERHLEKTFDKNFWQSEKLIEIRNANKQNLLPTIGCYQCIYMEENGSFSRRTSANNYYNSTATDLSGPRGLELSIDYTCNLACVYCSPELSTQWRIELNTPKTLYPTRLKEDEIISVLEKIDLSNLDNIHFYGGDPFFTKTHEVILEYINKRVGLDKLYVWYNTNGTIRVNKRVLDLWTKCRLIKIYFSIDDIGPRFEYLRYGAVWNEVEDNMFWFNENVPVNVMFAVQPTLSCMNALYHQDLINWKTQNFNTNRLGDSIDITRHNTFGKFELASMPDELLDKVLTANTDDTWFVDFVKSFKFNAHCHSKTVTLIKKLDARRGLSFDKVFPELVPYFTRY